MRRYVLVCACITGVLLGGLGSYLFTAEARERLISTRQLTVPEEPFLTLLTGTVVSVNREDSTVIVEAASPYQSQGKIVLQVEVSEATQFSVQRGIEPAGVPAEAPPSGPGLADLRTGMSVIMSIERQPGALKATRLTVLQ